MPTPQLYKKARSWKRDQSTVDDFDFELLLNEISFYSEIRYPDYIQFSHSEAFPERLERWIGNVTDDESQKTLFRILDLLTFIDSRQMGALHRDAFRRIISQWLEPARSVAAMLAENSQTELTKNLSTYQIAELTTSCKVDLILKENDLAGLPRPLVLGPDPKICTAALNTIKDPSKLSGMIVCEDIVGSGNQAARVLTRLRQQAPSSWRILFVPLVILQSGLDLLQKRLKDIDILPVLVIPSHYCFAETDKSDDCLVRKTIRELIHSTRSRVLASDGEMDDVPSNAFGYGGSGALVVTCHNTPNNTIPLVHHKSPNWNPLFRRLHHKEGV